MSFTGKATYSAGSTLPEIAEDVSDIIGIISPFETPLLDHLGDSQRSATSTVHEWLEDALLPNYDTINDSTFTDPATDTTFVVENADRFQAGDQIQLDGSREVMLVTDTELSTNTLTVVRGYGGTTPEDLADNLVVHILGNAALEGADKPATRFTTRVRKQNYTQIFTGSVEVSGSQLAAQMLAIDDELDYQKQQRLRELIRDLENCVINGVAPATNQHGGDSIRRTMRGIIPAINTNQYLPGVGAIPNGDGANSDLLNEAIINAALRNIWESSSGNIDTIVINGFQKRRINSILFPNKQYTTESELVKNYVSVYESDFGVCKMVMSRWIPSDTVLLLDSSRVNVMPLAGRSFHFKPLSSTGDSEVGEVIGEYTLQMRNENAHGIIRGLGISE